jgi:UDP-4-amino-4,6-dideoxy-N-acetyl-beta-L-altrosamine N-acetyltransferase
MKNILLKNYTLLEEIEHKNLLKIRNSDTIREASLTKNSITLKEHLKWIETLKNDHTKKYYAIIYNQKIIGGVNIFDIDTQMRWGIFFDNKVGLIIKSIIPIYFLDFVFKQYQKDEIFAEIKKSNSNAVSYNKSIGFKIISENDIVTMRLDKKLYLQAKDGIILKRIIKKISLYNFKQEG